MPDTLTILQGLVGGAEKAANNIYAITQAREKAKKEDQTFQLDRKVKESQIKRAELDLDPDKIQFEKDKLKYEIQSHKSKHELNMLTIKNKESEEKRKLEGYQSDMRTAERLRPDIFGGGEEERGSADGVPNIPGMPYERPELREGESFKFRGMTMTGKKQVNTQEQMRIEAKKILDAGGTLSPEQKKLLYGYQEGITLEDLERGFGIEKGGDGGNQLRNQAIEELKKSGYPTTDANIEALLKQMQE